MEKDKIVYRGPPLPEWGMLPDPLPETAGGTEPDMYYVFPYTCIPIIKFIL